MQGYEDGDESSAGGALQKKRKDSAASSQGSKASATAGTGDKQTLKSEKEDGEKDEYGDDFEEDKTEGKIQHVEELIGCFDVISNFFSIICCPYTVFCEFLFYFNCSQHSFINIFFYSKAYGYIPPLK